MAQAAIPILAGTGVQILGAKMGWDPRLTAFASLAAGGIGGGMASGAFSGGTAAQAAIAPTATGAVWNPTTVGQGLASSTSGLMGGQGALATNAASTLGSGSYAQNMSPAYSAVDAVKAPFFDRTQADGSQGLSPADSLGVSMLDTFLQYELALAQQPPPRIPSSGGGGGGGGGASGPAYQGGGRSGPYKVVDFYGDGGTASYEPQPI